MWIQRLFLLAVVAFSWPAQAQLNVDIDDVVMGDGLADVRFSVEVSRTYATLIGESKERTLGVYHCALHDPLHLATLAAYGPSDNNDLANTVKLCGFDPVGADLRCPTKRFDDPNTGHTYTGGPHDGPVGGLYRRADGKVFRLESVADKQIATLRQMPASLPAAGKEGEVVHANIQPDSDERLWVTTKSGAVSVYTKGDGSVRLFRHEGAFADEGLQSLVRSAFKDKQLARNEKWLSNEQDLLVVQASREGSEPGRLHCFEREGRQREFDIQKLIAQDSAAVIDVALKDGNERFLCQESTQGVDSLVVRDGADRVIADLAAAKGFPELSKKDHVSVAWSARFAAHGDEVLACCQEHELFKTGAWKRTDLVFIRWDIKSNTCESKRVESAAIFDRVESAPVVRNSIAPPVQGGAAPGGK